MTACASTVIVYAAKVYIVETVFEKLEGIAKILLFLALLLVPAFFAEIFIPIAAIGWAIYYCYVFLSSIGFDHSKSLPWFFGDPATDAAISASIILSLLGLINGIKGSVAMLLTYAPFVFLNTIIMFVGLGVSDTYSEFKNKNYIENCGSGNFTSDGSLTCYYTVKNNKQLPCFSETTNVASNKIYTNTYSCKQ